MTVTVSVEVIADVHADEAYRRLIDFDRYPEMTNTVRSVEVNRTDTENVLESSWAVDFRGGILRWTERDTIDRSSLTLGFEQIVGDLEHFAGRWQVTPTDASCTVTFHAELDMGIPSLAAIIDPIAHTALRDNVLTILSGLLGQLHSHTGEPVEPSGGRSLSAVSMAGHG